MRTVLGQLLPAIVLVALGFLLKQAGRVRAGDAHSMARVLVSAPLPALVFLSLSRAELQRSSLLSIALCAVAIPLVVHSFAILAARAMRLKRETAGVMVISTLNSAIGTFVLPLSMAVYGQESLGMVASYDLGNTLVATSYAYYLATRYGGRQDWSWRQGVKKALTMPVLWADILGIAVNLAGIRLPQIVLHVLDPLAAASLPLGMLTLGFFVELRFPQWKAMLATIALRTCLGWMTGQALATLFGLAGLAHVAVSLGSLAPIGFFPVAYAALEGLDTDLAASTLSLSILLALLITPMVLAMYH